MSIPETGSTHPELEVQEAKDFDRLSTIVHKHKSTDVADLDPIRNGDIEKNAAAMPPLQREASGPPYSIFSRRMKAWIIFLVSLSAVISPFAATTYYPALNVMSDVLHVTPTLTNISITTYMVIAHPFLNLKLHPLQTVFVSVCTYED